MSLLPPHWLPAGGFFSRGCHPCLGLVTISFIFRCHVYGESPKRLWLFVAVRHPWPLEAPQSQTVEQWSEGGSAAAGTSTYGRTFAGPRLRWAAREQREAAFLGHTARHEPPQVSSRFPAAAARPWRTVLSGHLKTRTSSNLSPSDAIYFN